MKSTKKLLIAEIVILLLSVFMFVQATLAYFSSEVTTSATITAGSVEILLSESAVKHDSLGNLIEDPDSPKIYGSASGTVHDYGIVFPGQTIFKNPTIRNIGTNDAYIAAKMSITDGDGDIHRVIGFPDFDHIDITMMFGGGLFNESAHFGTWNGLENVTYNDNFAMLQIPDRAHGKYDVYFFILKPLTHDEYVTLFDTMFFIPEFTSEEMIEFSDLRVDIYGFGVQTSGFETCFDAMLGALPDYFSDFSQSV